MEIKTIYESASTDGYNHSGDGRLYLTWNDAKKASNEKHGNYGVDPIEHLAIKNEDGRFYLLKSAKPLSLTNSPQAREDLAINAFNKLSKEEREALGLTEPRKAMAKDTSQPWPVMLRE